MKKQVLIGLLGTKKDARESGERPTLMLCKQRNLKIARVELLHQPEHYDLANELKEDIEGEGIEVTLNEVKYENPWDFERVYTQLLKFATGYKFGDEEYLVHISTGTHVAQICLFLLVKSGFISGKLIQFVPRENTHAIIDLNDLSKYSAISELFSRQQVKSENLLKDGIETKNTQYNILIEEVETIAVRTNSPLLLTGLTGTGKTKLAKQIHELKKDKGMIKGNFVSVNCATLHGDTASSALFGHKKGAFTGAIDNNEGYLKAADGGILFLDEIGELGLEVQAMLLKAIEEKHFMPVGETKEISSNFSLIAGTNRNLFEAVRNGRFREDLLARINIWTFKLPSLKERLEDLEANIKYELDQYTKKNHIRVSFDTKAKSDYLRFAKSPEALWCANFRDLNASISRMATLAENNKITQQNVDKEIKRLLDNWSQLEPQEDSIKSLHQFMDNPEKYDLFDQLQLLNVIPICQKSKSAADAGRKLFNVSRLDKKQINDTKRISDFLSGFDLHFEDIS